MGNVLMVVAVGGLLVNILAFAILHGGSKEDNEAGEQAHRRAA